jgi:hypothetical protein
MNKLDTRKRGTADLPTTAGDNLLVSEINQQTPLEIGNLEDFIK